MRGELRSGASLVLLLCCSATAYAYNHSEASDVFCPFFTTQQPHSSHLFLLNTGSVPFEAYVFSSANGNQEIELAELTLGGAQHAELALVDLPGNDQTKGSLRLTHDSEQDSLSAWVTIQSDEGVFEIPCTSRAKFGGGPLFSFWDRSLAPPKQRPAAITYELLNTTAESLEFMATFGSARHITQSVRGTIPSKGRWLLEVPQAFRERGWLRLEHDGEPGSLMGVGLLSSESHIAALAFNTLGETTQGPQYEAIRMPDSFDNEGHSTSANITVSLLNPGEEANDVGIELVNQTTGAVQQTVRVKLQPWEVRTIQIPLPAKITPEHQERSRVRIEGSKSHLLVRGALVSREELRDLAFFSTVDAHAGGTYPLPDPDAYSTVTAVLNVGDEPAVIVGQVYWTGGTYSIGPINVPPGTTYEFDFRTMAEDDRVDLAGRQYDRDHPNGVFKWTMKGGTSQLLGRTEATNRKGDNFGFSCFGCCYQTPWATVLPTTVSFPFPGDEPFVAATMFNTCTGVMGPYEANVVQLTTPAPFTWDAFEVGATEAADGDLSFSADEPRILASTCEWLWKRIFGAGKALMCQLTFNPKKYKPTQTCASQTSTCALCGECCAHLYNEQVCQCGNLAACVTSAGQARQHCDTICLTDRC